MTKKTLVIAAIALLSLIAGTGALGATSPTSSALPTDGAFEGFRLAFTTTAQRQRPPVDRLERARLQQVLALINARQAAEVEFAGIIGRNSVTGQWTVAGLAMHPTGATVYDGILAAGLHAHVRAQIRDDGTLDTLHVHTMTHAAAASARQHAAEWQRDDHGIHLGEVHHTSSDDHVSAHEATTVPQHMADPEHSVSAAGQQAPHGTPEPAHHPATPAPHQPPDQPQPAATQQSSHHGGESSHGDHSSGHH